MCKGFSRDDAHESRESLLRALTNTSPPTSGEDARLRITRFRPVAKRALATIEAADNRAATGKTTTRIYKKAKATQ
jgi:hypothetical protein